MLNGGVDYAFNSKINDFNSLLFQMKDTKFTMTAPLRQAG